MKQKSRMVKRLLRSTGLGLAWLTLVGQGPLLRGGAISQASYTNRDIQAMKAHYQPHHNAAKPPILPDEIADLPYRPPNLVPWILPYQSWDLQLRNYFQ